MEMRYNQELKNIPGINLKSIKILSDLVKKLRRKTIWACYKCRV